MGRPGRPVRQQEAKEDTVSKPNSATFETTVAASGNNTGIVVPEEVIGQLAAGKRPAVLVDVNGYQYRSTVAVMGGRHMISISAAIRQATGLKGGDPIRVTLTVADAPPEVKVPEDFAQALAADERARAFFGELSNSMQRYHIDNINAAKSAETRQRRISKAIALFRDGKQR
jgi:antitoxin component of MazEF toxin-antitoxin module